MVGLCATALLAIGMAGCGSNPVKITGGGSLPKESGTAHLGFTVNTCSQDKVRGQMAYVDMHQGIAAHGEVRRTIECTGDSCNNCDAGDVQVNMEYRSLMSGNPGSGDVIACVSGGKHLSVDFRNGPFAGYTAEGDVRGNVQLHECTPPVE
jgi:hypothetical protein